MSISDAAKIDLEAGRIRDELFSLLDETKRRPLNKAAAKRLQELRERVQALDKVSTRLLSIEMATALAVRERLGRAPIDGDDILPEDEAKAEKLLASFDLR